MTASTSVRQLAPEWPLLRLSAEAEAWVASSVDAFAARHPIVGRSELSAAQSLTLAWFRYCCPPSPSQAGLELTSAVLFSWYWFHQHQTDPDYPRRVERFWWFLRQGGRPDSPLDAAAVELGVRLRALPGASAELNRFWYFLERTLVAFVWNAAARGGPVATVEHYEAQRTHTIFVQPWVELWRVIERGGAVEHLRCGAALERYEVQIRRHHYLTNDLCSVARDLAAGKQSLVRSVAHARGLSVVQAVQAVEGQLLECAERAEHERLAVLARATEPATLWYVEFLRTCARGNVEVMAELHDRYERVR